jgi:hypothetical protein
VVVKGGPVNPVIPRLVEPADTAKTPVSADRSGDEYAVILADRALEDAVEALLQVLDVLARLQTIELIVSNLV